MGKFWKKFTLLSKKSWNRECWKTSEAIGQNDKKTENKNPKLVILAIRAFAKQNTKNQKHVQKSWKKNVHVC